MYTHFKFSVFTGASSLKFTVSFSSPPCSEMEVEYISENYFHLFHPAVLAVVVQRTSFTLLIANETIFYPSSSSSNNFSSASHCLKSQITSKPFSGRSFSSFRHCRSFKTVTLRRLCD